MNKANHYKKIYSIQAYFNNLKIEFFSLYSNTLIFWFQ